jgi:hypothetical protein
LLQGGLDGATDPLYEDLTDEEVPGPIPGGNAGERGSGLRHVFVDVSNTAIGFKHANEVGAQLDWSKLIGCLTRNEGGYRFAGGSQRRDLKCLQDLGFLTKALERNRQNKEEGVDEVLHAQIYRQRDLYLGRRCTFVIVTGDGNKNGGLSNFPEIVKSFRNYASFSVEIWAWSRSLSSALEKAGRSLGDRFRVYRLDGCDLRRSSPSPSNHGPPSFA